MKKLLFTINKKDFETQTFKAGGPGGQHQNKTDSAVRIIHKASNARGECRTSRSQHQNKRIALKNLTVTNEFKLWINRAVHEITTGETIEEKVDKAMTSKNIKVEGKNEKNQWINL